MPNPAAVTDAHGEWIEILNTADRTLTLEGLVIGEMIFDDRFTVNRDVRVGPGEYFVFGRDEVPETNGGLEVGYRYTGMTLSNDTDELTIASAAGVIDHVGYDTDWPMTAGHSLQFGGQHDPRQQDNARREVWCSAEPQYGAGDHGTPGGPNPPCP